MDKKYKNKKKGKGVKRTAMKTDKKMAIKKRKMLEKLGEPNIIDIIAKLEAEEARRSIITEEVFATAPPPRCSFTFVAHPEKDELIFFGGEFFNGQRAYVYKDLYFYNINRCEWKLVNSPGGPTARSGHQMLTVATDGGQLWLFGGGYASPSQKQYYHYKDLWVMSLKTSKWEKINAPNGPSARSGHRMVASKKKLFVFGGFHDNDQSYRYFNDMHVFSLESYEWMQVDIIGTVSPSPRADCCIAVNPEGKIIIWGGCSKGPIKHYFDRGITYTDMFAFVPKRNLRIFYFNASSKKMFNIAENASHSLKFKWIAVEAGGYKPYPCRGVGCCSAPNGKAYCFGGLMDIDEDGENVMDQFGVELLALDLRSLKWHPIEEKGKKLKCNTSAEDLELTENVLYQPSVKANGVYKMSVVGPSTKTAPFPNIPNILPCPNQEPSPRMNAGLCVCKGKLYLYGGLCQEDKKLHTFNDFYALDLHKLGGWKVLSHDFNCHEWIESSDGSSSDGSTEIDYDENNCEMENN